MPQIKNSNFNQTLGNFHGRKWKSVDILTIANDKQTRKFVLIPRFTSRASQKLLLQSAGKSSKSRYITVAPL